MANLNTHEFFSWSTYGWTKFCWSFCFAHLDYHDNTNANTLPYQNIPTRRIPTILWPTISRIFIAPVLAPKGCAFLNWKTLCHFLYSN